ncbi:hypothetical protein D1AOALGA4SA_5227 [Olavius algarvensis Delta 1 endosymbiont]|nr:hypothetical protein D1AOALGA4SA_5227 [Olavius algarvensis Delta 1 endosymbiont]
MGESGLPSVFDGHLSGIQLHRLVTSKDPGPEEPALSSAQRGGVYLGLPME